jgi:prepilin-type N-terminal cleavage/methylation domain-containing protein/prepilin-type processing-associated H-X9-DG protein
MKPRPRVTPFHPVHVRGFTLVELLAVIAIVAVLAGLILATLGPMRAAARQAKCAANLRSIGGAFNQFAADYDGYYPAVTYNTGHLDGKVNPNKSHWWVELKPYIGVDIKTIGGIEGNPFAICPDGLTGMNSKMNYYFQTPRVTIGQPAKTILVGDSKSHALSVWIGDPTGEKFESSDPQRHNGLANYLFADGHLEKLSVADASKVMNRDPYAP